MARVVSWFSCGAASAVATKLAIQNADGREVVVAYCDTFKREHPDNIRFLRDCERWFGQEVLILGNDEYDRDPDVVFRKTRFLVGPKGARCTAELKRSVRLGFQRPDDTVVLGYTAEEYEKRHKRTAEAEPLVNFWPVLWERGLTKDDCLGMVARAGIELPEMYKLGYRNNNCFAGETEFVTDKGVFRLQDKAGETVNILNREGWQPAHIRSFGVQPLMEIHLSNGPRRKVIRATPDHGWVTPRYVNASQGTVTKTTSELQVGDRPLINFAVPDLPLDRIGVQHGFVFGDGNLMPDGKSRAYVAEGKEDILPWFDRHLTPARYIHSLPGGFKELPDEGAPMAYKIGFFAGLIASDASVSKSGVKIANKSADTIAALSKLAQSIGMVAWAGETKWRATNYSASATLTELIIPRACVPEEMIIRAFHKARLPKKTTRPKAWRVDRVVATDSVEEVYCATVLGESEFTLDGGILTQNCIGCVKGQAGYWNKIRVDFPERFAEMAAIERELGRAICKREWTEDGVRHLERIPLDRLPPDLGRYDSEPDISCGIICQSASTEIEDCDAVEEAA